jgi:hypothetical protein
MGEVQILKLTFKIELVTFQMDALPSQASWGEYEFQKIVRN